MNYTHLTLEERYQIRDASHRGDSSRRIGKAMDRHRSTIERELRRNVGVTRYEARSAHALSAARASASNARPRLTAADWGEVEDSIRADWSPEQISGRRRLEGLAAVSPEWIYRRIEKDHRARGTLSPHLRCRKHRRKRYGAARRPRFGSRRSIHERPQIVQLRARVGDWEADTMRFAKGRAVAFTAIERKTLYAVMAKASNGTARAVTKALLSVLAPLASRVHTLTMDNGCEFAENTLVDIALDAKTYFADPYSPQQRGCNENWNGLARQYLPRSIALSHVSDDEISTIQDKLNNRPRKKLGFRTPKEMFLRSLNRGALRS